MNVTVEIEVVKVMVDLVVEMADWEATMTRKWGTILAELSTKDEEL